MKLTMSQENEDREKHIHQALDGKKLKWNDEQSKSNHKNRKNNAAKVITFNPREEIQNK